MLLTLVFCMLATIATTTTLDTPTTNAPSATVAKVIHLTPEIVNELKDFLALIPTATVDEIVAKHFVVDGNFRKAIKYLRSTQFTQLLANVQQIPEIVEILDFLHLNNGSSTSSNLVGLAEAKHQTMQWIAVQDDNECELAYWQQQLARATDNLPLQIELLPFVAEQGDGRTLHSFSTFVEELLAHLPRLKYTQMINEKRQQSAAFAAFYAALRSSQFEVMLEAALKSSNLSKSLQTLSNNNVDVNSLKTIALRLIAWGPSV